RRSALAAIKAEWEQDQGGGFYHAAEGKAVTFKRAAKRIGVRRGTLRRLLRDWKFPGEKPRVVPRRPALRGGKREETLFEADVERIRGAISTALRRAASLTAFGSLTQLVEAFGVQSAGDRLE